MSGYLGISKYLQYLDYIQYLQAGAECHYDYLQLYSGTRAVAARSLGKFCSSAAAGPRVLETEDSAVLVR